MSEDLTEAAESAETARAVESEAPSSPPPWGEDFNPERAWKTIVTQRDRERELEPDAKAWKRFREDEQYRREVLGELGYEVGDDDDDEFDDSDFTDEPRGNPELEKRLAQLEQERAADRYERDLTKAVGQRALSDQGKDWVQYQTMKGGNNPAALEKAVNAWFEYEDSLRTAARDEYLKSKKAPNTPPQSGRAGEQQFDPTDRKSRRARFAAIAEAQAD